MVKYETIQIHGDQLTPEVSTQILNRMDVLYNSNDEPSTAIDIYCRSAINRSGFVVSLFLAKTLNISIEEAAKITKDLISGS